MKTTMKDVAQLAGVSFKTVSRVVNNESGVKPALREKVLASIKYLNYHPNQSARNLRGKPSTIGLIYNNPNSHYVVTILHGILAQCRESNYELLVHPCVADLRDAHDEIETMLQRTKVAGLILTPPFSENAELIAHLDEQGVSFVRIISSDTEPSDMERTIYINDRQAAYNITQHLIGLGHRKIAFFNGETSHKSSGERLEGYKQALQENGIEQDKDWILAGEYSFKSGVERLKGLVAVAKMPTAIFACNDEIAAGALFAARLLKIDVPQQLSVVGFEGSPFSEQTWPALTTVDQQIGNVARRAAELLLNKLTDNQMENEIVHEFLPELVERDSTQAIN